MIYRTAIATLLQGRSLARAEADALMRSLLSGELTAAQIAAILTVLATRGVSADEMTGFASVMRGLARTITVAGDPMDTCGTGGSGLSTLNTSTMAAFVLAAGGVKVVKHGNRASSGRCGSMDVLERLGVDVELEPSEAEAIAAEAPFVFLNARKHHPALGPLAPIRKDLGFRTVFNFLGPLCNPAGTRRQLLGASDARHAAVLAHTLHALGAERALVVAGADGLDELALHGPSRVWHVRRGEPIREETIRPEDFGFAPAGLEQLEGGDVECNARWFETILGGKHDGPRAAHTALNAGAAFWVSGHTQDMRTGVALAREVLASGKALGAVEHYRVLVERRRGPS